MNVLSLPQQSQRIIEQLRECLPEILQDYPVMVAYLYGSFAVGATTPFSDVDIALVLSPDLLLSPYEQFILELDIEVKLETACGLSNADVRTINQAPIAFQGRVLTESILLYSRDEDFRVEYEAQTRQRYFDFLPVLKRLQNAYFDALEG